LKEKLLSTNNDEKCLKYFLIHYDFQLSSYCKDTLPQSQQNVAKLIHDFTYNFIYFILTTIILSYFVTSGYELDIHYFCADFLHTSIRNVPKQVTKRQMDGVFKANIWKQNKNKFEIVIVFHFIWINFLRNNNHTYSNGDIVTCLPVFQFPFSFTDPYFLVLIPLKNKIPVLWYFITLKLQFMQHVWLNSYNKTSANDHWLLLRGGIVQSVSFTADIL
jgi:hypothetical protein